MATAWDDLMKMLTRANPQDLLSFKQWLKRRFEMFHSMLEGSWSYQEMVQKGIDQGLEKGIKQGLEKGVKQGIEQGELKASKRLLARVVETRFPPLSSMAQIHTEHIQDIDTLNAVIDKLLLAETVEQARQAFLEMTSSESSS